MAEPKIETRKSEVAAAEARIAAQIQAAKEAREAATKQAAAAAKRAEESRQRAAESQRRADEAEAEAARQEKTGRGPKFKAAKAAAAAARARASEALAAAEKAEQRADQATRSATNARREATEAINKGEKSLSAARKAEAERVERERAIQVDKENRVLAIRASGIAAGVVLGPGVQRFVIDAAANRAFQAKNAQLSATADAITKLQKSKAAGSAAQIRGLAQQALSQNLLGHSRGRAAFIMAGGLAANAVVSATLSKTVFKDNELLSTISETAAITQGTAAAALTVGELVARQSNANQLSTVAGGIVRGAIEQNKGKLKGIPAALLGTSKSTAEAAAKSADKIKATQAAATASAGQLATRGRGATGPSIKELRAQAKALGIKNASRINKNALIGLVENASKGSKNAAVTTAISGGSAASGSTSLIGSVASGTGKVLGTVFKYGSKALLPAAVALAGLTGFSTAARSREQGDNVALASLKGIGVAADEFTGGNVRQIQDIRQRIAENAAGQAKQRKFEQEFGNSFAESTAANFGKSEKKGPVSEGVSFIDRVNADAEKLAWAPTQTPSERQSEGMTQVARASNVALLNDTPTPADHTASQPWMQVASDYAREGKVRAAGVPKPTPVQQALPPSGSQPSVNTGKLRGFANPEVQRAAQEARRRKARGG